MKRNATLPNLIGMHTPNWLAVFRNGAQCYARICRMAQAILFIDYTFNEQYCPSIQKARESGDCIPNFSKTDPFYWSDILQHHLSKYFVFTLFFLMANSPLRAEQPDRRALNLTPVSVLNYSDRTISFEISTESGQSSAEKGTVSPYSTEEDSGRIHLPFIWHEGIKIKLRAYSDKGEHAINSSAFVDAMMDVPAYEIGKPITLWLIFDETDAATIYSSRFIPTDQYWPGIVRDWPPHTFRNKYAIWSQNLEEAKQKESKARESFDSIRNLSEKELQAYWESFYAAPDRKRFIKHLHGPTDREFKRVLRDVFRSEWLESAHALNEVVVAGQYIGERYRKETETIIVLPGQENQDFDVGNEPATSETVNDGIEYLKLRACRKGIRKLLPSARNGDIHAQIALGNVYRGKCVDVSKNANAHLSWLNKAAENGSADAQRMIANHHLGDYISQGHKQRALTWFQKAASNGDRDSFETLAMAYRFGGVVKKDVVLAHLFKLLSLRMASIPEDTSQDVLFYTDLFLTPAQLAEANTLATKWKIGMPLPTASQTGHDSALEWFQKAARTGDTEACYRLGMIYKYDEDNDEIAAEWLRKAAEQNHPEAIDVLWQMYINGQGVPRDVVLAYFLRAQIVPTNNQDSNNTLSYLKTRMTIEQLEEAKELTLSWKVGSPLPRKTRTGLVRSND